MQGGPLELNRQAVFQVIEQGAYGRRIKPQSSRQFLERLAYVSVPPHAPALTRVSRIDRGTISRPRASPTGLPRRWTGS